MVRGLFIVAALAAALVVTEVHGDDSSSFGDLSFSYDLWDSLPCIYMGKIYLHGNVWKPHPCAQCQCADGTSLCTFRTCPKCDGVTKEAGKNECCDSCDGKEVQPTETDFCFWRGETYQNKEDFTLNPCTDCSCQSGIGKCAVRSCPPMDCDPVFIREVPGKCCPVCDQKK